uniref:EGF_CA domain-containing protein n=1 Tax=Steinernema glaseri TaxID=37863 RepID=A0A1I7Z5K9_9BILA
MNTGTWGSIFWFSLLTSDLVFGVRIRFSYLAANYVGEFGAEKPISDLHDCTETAFAEKSVGYRIRIKGETMACSLLKSFTRFKASKGNQVRDYILTTNIDDGLCARDSARNVTGFLSKPCDPESGDCALLEKIADYCRFVGSDIANCVSPRKLQEAECPPGQERVDLKKGKLLCCPVGEKFAKEVNGKAFCCPGEREFKDVVNGKPVCCSPGENHQKGATLCCPSGKSYSKLGETESCCEDGEELSKSSDGETGCCPKGENFGKTKNGTTGCCPKEKEFKDVVDGKPICCLPGENHTSGTELCCPSGTQHSKYGEKEQCCENGKILTKQPIGNVYYCEDRDKAFNANWADLKFEPDLTSIKLLIMGQFNNPMLQSPGVTLLPSTVDEKSSPGYESNHQLYSD